MSATATTISTGERRVRSGPPRSPELRLRADDVDLWRVPLDACDAHVVQQLEALLSADEAARVHRFFFERDRRRAIIARGTLRLLLARYTGRPAREVRFTYGSYGKPALDAGMGQPELFFNVSHTEDLALYAITRTGEVGIDAERVRELPDWEQIASSCFSSKEAARIRATAEDGRPVEFLRAWTEHEAVLKARGTGLGSPAALDARCGNAPETSAALRVHALEVGPQFVATLAVSAHARWATCRRWQPAVSAGQFHFSVSSRRERIDPLSQTSISLP